MQRALDRKHGDLFRTIVADFLTNDSCIEVAQWHRNEAILRVALMTNRAVHNFIRPGAFDFFDTASTATLNDAIAVPPDLGV